MSKEEILAGNIANPGMVSMPVEEPTGMPALPSAGQNVLSNPTAPVAPPPGPASVTPAASDEKDGSIDGKGSFAQQLAKHADAIGVPAGVGGWAKSLVGAAQRTLAGMDIGKIPEGGGALDGIAKVMANRQQMDMADRERKDKLKQQDVLNKRADRQDAREDERVKSYMATEALTRTMTAKAISQGDLKDLELGQHMGEQAMKPLMTGAHPTQRLQTGLTSSQATQLVQDKKLDPLQHHFFQDGIVPVEGQKDAYGNQKYQATFSVFGDTPDVTLDKENAARFAKYSGQSFKEGDHLTGVVYGQLDSQSQSAQVAEHQALDEAAAAGIKTDKLAQEVAKNKMVNSGDWTTAMQKEGVDGDPRKAMKYVSTDPKMIAKYGNPGDVAMNIYGGADGWEKIVSARSKDDLEAAKAKHEEEMDKAVTALNDLTGEGDAFLEQLNAKDPALAQRVMQIGEGRDVLSARERTGKNGAQSPISLAVARAYPKTDTSPGYDKFRSDTFAKLRTEYSAQNKTGGQIQSYGVAMNHMKRLWDNTLDPMSQVPGTDAYRKRDEDSHFLAHEMANALTQMGKANESTEQELYTQMTGALPSNLRVRIQEANHLLGGKMPEIRQRWKNAIPNPQKYNPPMPGLSDQALANEKFINDADAQSGKLKLAPTTGPVSTPGGDFKGTPEQRAHYLSLVAEAKAKAASAASTQRRGLPTGVPGSIQPEVK